MNKKYVSPDLEIVKFHLNADVLLHISRDETPASSGFIEDPEDDLLE